MKNLVLTPIPIRNIHLITKNGLHIPSKKSMSEYNTLFNGPLVKLTVFKWDNQLYYVDNFYEIALQKEFGPTNSCVYAEILNVNERDDVIYMTLRNSYTNKIGIQKLNQFRFDLVQELSNPSIDGIKKKTGLKENKIREFSFHTEMSRKGKKHAEQNRDLSMMNKIWSSPIIISKSRHIRPYLESMRIDGYLKSNQFQLIENYVRRVVRPFHDSNKVFEKQIHHLLSHKEINDQVLFKEVENIGLLRPKQNKYNSYYSYGKKTLHIIRKR